MKNYRSLAPIVMILLVVLSWYKMLSQVSSENSKYEAFIAAARSFAEDDISSRAFENYRYALEVKNTIELYSEIVEYSKQLGNIDNYIDWSLEMTEQYPQESKPYEYLLDAYLLDKDYKSCYRTLDVVTGRNIQSPIIEQIRNNIMYEYKTEYGMYSDVGAFCNNYCAVKAEDHWGFVDYTGTLKVKCTYQQVGVFTSEGICPVKEDDGSTYFILNNGEKELNPKEKYMTFGNCAEDRIPAQKSDGEYIYIDTRANPVLEGYEYASSFNNGLAAVKKSGSWYMIKTDGTLLNDTKYVDVKLDEREMACRNNRYFAALEPGKYHMYDISGTQIGNDVYSDASVFLGESVASVKIDGKWLFVDENGTKKSDKVYEEARSFNCGLAAVKLDGKWGYVNMQEKVVISPQYQAAQDFNSKGSCFVKTDDKWRMIKLYRYNH